MMPEPAEVKRLITESVLICAVAAVIAIAANLVNPRGYILVGKEAARLKNISFISVDEAKVKFDAGVALFLDARSAGEYAGSRISGAINIPAGPESTSMKAIESYFQLLNEKKELVIYCEGGGCDDAEVLARRLLGLGYSRVLYVIKQGLPEWREREYPVEGDDR